MRRTSATTTLGPADRPVVLAELRCRCGDIPTVFASQDAGNGMNEVSLCMPCAVAAGWPWMVGERMSKRRLAEAKPAAPWIPPRADVATTALIAVSVAAVVTAGLMFSLWVAVLPRRFR